MFRGMYLYHEEPIRQYIEKWFHDVGEFRWTQIVAEAPIKIGSSIKRADVVVLRNENKPISPENYFLIAEAKMESGFVHPKVLESAKMQLISYLGASNAISGYVFNSDLVPVLFQKDVDGKILPQGSKDLGRRRQLGSGGVYEEVRGHKSHRNAVFMDNAIREIQKVLQIALLNKEISPTTFEIWRMEAKSLRELVQ